MSIERSSRHIFWEELLLKMKHFIDKKPPFLLTFHEVRENEGRALQKRPVTPIDQTFSQLHSYFQKNWQAISIVGASFLRQILDPPLEAFKVLK